MIKTTAMIVSAVALVVLAGCEPLQPPSATAMTSWDCRDHPEHIKKGQPPVVSYYCPAPPGSPKPVQLDVYITGYGRQGPQFLACSVPPLPQDVFDEFCTS